MDSAAIIKLLTGGGAAAASAMNPVTAGLAAIPEAYKLGLAIKEGIEAKKIREGLQRPTMVVPASVREGTDLSRMNVYDTRMPGQNIAIENLLRQQASGNQGIMSAGGGSAERMAAMVGMNQASMDASNQLAQQAAQQQVQDVNSFMNQLNQQGAYEQQAWDWNQKEKFLSAAAAAKQLGDASNQNLYGGLKGMGGAIASAITTPELTQKPPIAQPEAQAGTPILQYGPPTEQTWWGAPESVASKSVSIPLGEPGMRTPAQDATSQGVFAAMMGTAKDNAASKNTMMFNPGEVDPNNPGNMTNPFAGDLNAIRFTPSAGTPTDMSNPFASSPPQVGSTQMAMTLMNRLGPQIAAIVAQQPKAVQEQVAMGGPLPVSVMNPYNPAASYGQGVNAASQPVQEPVFDPNIGGIVKSIPGFRGLLKGL